jgi:hypothetical protein
VTSLPTHNAPLRLGQEEVLALMAEGRVLAVLTYLRA